MIICHPSHRKLGHPPELFILSLSGTCCKKTFPAYTKVYHSVPCTTGPATPCLQPGKQPTLATEACLPLQQEIPVHPSSLMFFAKYTPSCLSP